MTGTALGDFATGDPEELRARIDDLEQTLNAIRDGDVDGLVLGEGPGQQLYSRESADRPYRVIVEEMGDGALTVSDSGTILYANQRFAQLVRTERTALLGRHVTELAEPDSPGPLTDLLTAVPGRTRRGELLLHAASGDAVPVLASVTGLEIDGDVVRCLIAADLTDRRRAEQDLARANAELSRSAAELAEAQRIGSIGSWHWDPATDALTWSAQMYRILAVTPSAEGLTLPASLRTFHPEDAALTTAAFDRALADHQPFVLEQRVVRADGNIGHTLTRGEVVDDGGTGARAIRGTTQDVTEQRRSAAAVVEAREALVRRTMQLEVEHRVKESLQRAVLPARLPRPDGVELAARYLPADRPAMVGGDWYDAFPLPGGGGLAVAVGDVVGHDLDAAATMGQMRNALRAYAFENDQPDVVLGRLNRLAVDVDDGGLATALLGHLEPGGRVFRWAGAGHLPPLVIGRAGVRLLPAVAGTMLGVRPEAAFGLATTELHADDLILLYTDGLIERRDRDLDAGFAALLDAATGLAGEPAEEVCTALVERMLPTRGHDDDVCLLAVRSLPKP